MDIVKDIAAVIGLILSTIALITACTKGGRAFIKRLFARETREIHEENIHQSNEIKNISDDLQLVLKKLDGLEEVSKQQCRDTIKTIYYKYYKIQTIPLYERKTADRTYELYKGLFSGNSYATLLYTEICKWEIDPTLDLQHSED